MVASLPTHTDVLIVGAGPAGLALAASLAQLGVDHTVVDRAPGPSTGSRAAAVQPRTLEYLDRIHVADTLIDDGLPGRGFVVADRDRTLLRTDYGRVASPFPFLLLISQQQTELRLLQRLEALGGRVHRGVRLLTLQDEFPGTAATLVDSTGIVRVIHARYVAGCDGLHSRVRDQAGGRFPGEAPATLFAVADARASGRPDDDLDTTFTLAPAGLLITSALPGDQLRLVAGVAPGTTAPTPAELDDLIATRGGRAMRRLRITEVVASSTYRVQQRVADRLRLGDVFLVGDAAHTHSPAGGQGMNTGIQDAGNLAWKLALALDRARPIDVLDTYQSERHPVAAELIAFTAQLMAVATVADPGAAAVRNDVIAAAAGVPGVTDLLATKLAQLDIDYADRTAGPMAPGRRAPLDLAPADDLTWSVGAPDDAGQSTYVRPDGIVADPELGARILDREGATP
ncbi:pentachlorophenol monooxygenase [Mycolicibacterium madagascariense]|uniref:Pentachlorophenol monooxygenase n=1 Tax=Mycolicibacterium madagascariense TaxID=212765 RepID=A0A7I7XAJ5_9MYCO|nr:FAD-dependent monooxygenase [Mycolicibacterium madagascariense]MCV7014874.1 FAD-dependent monooxygenase [Mycolicibacterium madagascariense]BBZ26584.1 pentachlorophenol monooxygenase [Mycolicibacterium madagascariense]